MIIGYARVSSLDQDFAGQVDRLKQAGAEMIFSEKQSGRSADNRPELQNALNVIRKGDVLLVTKLDRLARSTKDAISILNRLNDREASLRCVDQPLSTDGPTGKLMFDILAAFAEFENAIRRERQMEGIARAKANGVYDVKGNEIPPQVLAVASRFLRKGMSYTQVVEKMNGRVSMDTLQRRFPKYKNRQAVQREERKRQEREVLPPSAPQVVANQGATIELWRNLMDAEPGQPIQPLEPDPPKKRGLFGLLR